MKMNLFVVLMLLFCIGLVSATSNTINQTTINTKINIQGLPYGSQLHLVIPAYETIYYQNFRNYTNNAQTPYYYNLTKTLNITSTNTTFLISLIKPDTTVYTNNQIPYFQFVNIVT